MDDTDKRIADIITLAEEEFGPFQDEAIHLNHAGIAPLPNRTSAAIADFAKQNAPYRLPQYTQWERTAQSLRQAVQRLIHASSADEIAFVKNTSEGLSFVAYGIDWQAGDNIVFGQQEFPSNRIIWEAVGERFGVQLRCVDLFDGTHSPEEALCQHIDSHTRLLSTSSVQYAYGYRMNLEKLGAVCRENNALFCIDAIQSLGMMPLDVQAIQADFVSADGHKWLLAPEGMGIFYCRAGLIEQIKLNQMGWAAVENPNDYDTLFHTPLPHIWDLADGARRFEAGSLNNLGIHALDASVGLVAEVGVSEISQQVADRIDYIFEHLKQGEYQVLTPPDRHQRAGIITFKLASDTATQDLFATLKARGVLCAYRGGGIRFSPHFYTPYSQLDTVLSYL